VRYLEKFFLRIYRVVVMPDYVMGRIAIPERSSSPLSHTKAAPAADR